jgi:hypothetical protein
LSFFAQVKEFFQPRILKFTNNNLSNDNYDMRIVLMTKIPVLYKVGQQAKIWNMNSSVWTVWAALCSKEKDGFEFF